MSEATKPDRKIIKQRMVALDSEYGLNHAEFKCKDILQRLRYIIRAERKSIKICPCCDQSIEDITISFTKQYIVGMYKVYIWLGSKGRHEFKTSEIKHLLDKSTYANIGHWQKFGGIFYKTEDTRGYWGVNMERAKAFFSGNRTAPTQIIKDRFTGKINASTEKYIQDFPNINDFLDENEDYQSRTVIPDHNAAKKIRPTVPEYVQKPYKD